MPLIANNQLLDNGADRLVSFDKVAELVAQAEQPAPKISQGKAGAIALEAGAENWLPRSGTLYGRIRNQAGIGAKLAALGALGVALASSSPATLQFQGRTLRNVTFQGAKPVQDQFLNHPSAVNYAAPFVTKDPFWYDLAPWGAMGYWNLAQTFGLNVNGTSVALRGTSTGGQEFVLPLASGQVSITVPGTAPTYGVGSVTVTGANAPAVVYLKSDKGTRYTPVTLTSGVGVVKLSDRLYLAPGANVISVYTLGADGTFSLVNTTTYPTTLNLAQTYARWLELESSATTPPLPFALSRTGSATYIGTDGVFKTAGDGVARMGLPWVSRRNLANNSVNLQNATNWSPNRGSVLSGDVADPFGGTGAFLFKEDTQSGGHYISNLGSITSDAGKSYTLSVFARAKERRYLYLVLFESGNGSNATFAYFDLLNGTFTGNGGLWASGVPSITSFGGGWYRVSVTITTPSAVILRWQINTAQGTSTSSYAGDGVSGLYLYGPQLDLGTMTSYQPTGTNGVDLTHSLNGAGIVLEGPSANLLAENSADFEIDAVTKLQAVGSGAEVSWTRVASTAGFSGNALRVTCTVTTDFRGVRLLAATPEWVSVGNGETITGSAWVNVIQGKVRIALGNGPWVAYSAHLEPGWRLVSISWTNNTGSAQSVALEICQDKTDVAAVYEIDKAQLEKLPFRTSWMKGGTSRAGDVLGIVEPHNLLKHSEDLTRTWSISDVTVTPNNTAAPNNTMTAAKVAKTATVSRAFTQNLTIAAPVYTFSIWLKADSLTTADIYIYDTVLGSGRSPLKACPLTSEWQRFTVTTTSPLTLGNNLRVYVYPGGANQATGGSIFAWGAQVTEGYHPGVYVPTLDAAVPAPASIVFEPGFSQNGAFEFDAVIPVISLTDTNNRGIFGDLNTSICRLIQYGGTGGGRIFFVRRDATSLTSRTVFSTTNPTVMTDGNKHRYRMEWTNYTLDGVRYMWQRLYIDGVLVAEQDVAALFGSTAWSTIDPSNAGSDGFCYSVLSNITPLRPTKIPDRAVLTAA